MKTSSLLLLLALAGVAVATAVSAGPPDLGLDDEGVRTDAVQARLISDRLSVAPGETFWVGVHLHQDEGWHTYWRNGGDSGLPTEVEWTLPEGWEVGELHWPTPERQVEVGDLVTYGYEGDVVLMAEIRVPSSAPRGEHRIDAAVNWLMCKELCIPGDAEVSLSLEVGSSVPNPSERDNTLLSAARMRWPTPSEEFDAFQVRALRDLSVVPPGQIAHGAVEVAGLGDPASVKWTWFPYEQDSLFPHREAVKLWEDRLWVHFPFELEATAVPGETLDWGGVLQLEVGSRSYYVGVSLPVPVAAAKEAIVPQNAEVFAKLLGGGGLFDQSFEGQETPHRSLIYYLFLALVGGLILNVMPCVLPVLSLKVMGFVNHSQEDRGVQLRLGLTFALGVLASFLALGLVVIGLQAAGDQLGWGFQFQNPVFVVAMAAVVFAFGLSLFGVYEIILPLNLSTGTGHAGAYAESFLNGILATALATPCTAPFLGTALGFAFTQSSAAILAIFLTIGVGLSLPYVVLSSNPAWLRFVPKPGAWMDRFKQGMGFLLMATLVWLLWVLGQQIGADGVIATMAFLVVLAAALWLYGAFLGLGASRGRRALIWSLMVALVGGGWWQFLREPLSSEAVVSAASASQRSEGRWEPFSVATLEREVAAGRTVFLDFTAAWCTTCKVNEATVLRTEVVEQKLDELQVVTLQGDWTNRDEEITKVLRKFGRSGVPFYAVFPAGRLDAPIVLPELITQKLVLDALEEAGPSRSTVGR